MASLDLPGAHHFPLEHWYKHPWHMMVLLMMLWLHAAHSGENVFQILVFSRLASFGL